MDTATVRNLVAVSLSPLADCCGLGVALDRSGGATGGTGALGSGALHAAGLRYEGADSVTQASCVCGGQIDFVVSAVQAKTDSFVCGAAIEIVFKDDANLLCP